MMASERGPFIPTTYIYDIENLKTISLDSPQFRDFIVRVRQSFNKIATTLNQKDSGTYALTEYMNGQYYFEDPALNSSTPKTPIMRPVYRKVINFGALPNTGTTNVAHGITFPTTNTHTFTRIYGCSTDPVANTYIPIPYASPILANNIEISIDTTHVTITTGNDRSA